MVFQHQLFFLLEIEQRFIFLCLGCHGRHGSRYVGRPAPLPRQDGVQKWQTRQVSKLSSVVDPRIQIHNTGNWIRIILVTWTATGSASASNKNQNPDSIRIRFKVISWIRNRIHINFLITSQNVWNMSLFEHFMDLSFYLQARLWIRARIRIK